MKRVAQGEPVFLMVYSVYILRNTEGRLYIGQTSDLELRLRRHNEGKAFWTKGRGPWQLIHSENFTTRSAAMTQRDLQRLHHVMIYEVKKSGSKP